MHEELGKIESADFCFGGYQDVMVSFRLSIGGKGWGSTKEYIGGWAHISEKELKEDPKKWTHEDRIKGIGRAGWEIFQLMRKAKVKSLRQLEGIPIKAYFDSPCGQLRSIEILEEVL